MSRRKDLASIHIAKKELDLSEIEYRALIAGVMDELGIDGKASSANLNAKGRAELLSTLRDMGWNPSHRANERRQKVWKGHWKATGRPGKATQAQLDYLAMMVYEKGWHKDDSRTKGFIKRTIGKAMHPAFLRTGQASKVIQGMEAYTGRHRLDGFAHGAQGQN